MTLSRRKLFKFIIPAGTISLLNSKHALASGDVNTGVSKLDSGISNPYNTNTIISPLAFGGVSNNANIDNTSAILDAIKYAKNNHKALDLRGGPWRISKSLDFTLIKQVVTDWSGRLIVNPENFETDSGYVVTIGRPDDSFRKHRALYTSLIGSFLIISEGRSVELNGVYIKGSFLSLDSIRVINFNGTGICISATWDSTFTSISSELCGNEKKYQISIEPGKDTSNCLSISRIQSERAFHKCLAISCIRSVINAIHAERTQIMSSDDGTKKLLSGLSYSNVIINVGNTTINQIMYDNIKKNDMSDTDVSSVILNLDQSSIRDAQFVTSYVVANFGRCSSFNNMSVLNFFTGNKLTDCSMNNLRVIDKFFPLSNINVYAGVFNKILLTNKASNIFFAQSKISSLSFFKVTNNITLNNCIISEDLDLEPNEELNIVNRGDHSNELSDFSIPISFVDCIFNADVKGGENSIATFKGGFIKKVNLKNRAKYKFDNVFISEFGYKGEALYTTTNCKFGKINSWSPPQDDNYVDGETTEFTDGKESKKYIFKIKKKAWMIY